VKGREKMEHIVLTAKDIRALTGFSIPTIYNWFNTPGFPLIRVGRKKIVPREAFLSWLNEQAHTNK
jgi:predicted DNA-binding transcriptional regulator AlpA